MSIMNESHRKMRLTGESDQSFKKRFTAERSRQFDHLREKEAVFNSADRCSATSRMFTKNEYQVKPGDGRRLNHAISEYTKFLNKIDRLREQLKNHDSTFYRDNSNFLKQGTDFQHNFNKAEIESVQKKHSELTRELNIINQKMQDYKRIFKGMKGKYVTPGRRRKENRRKAKMRKKKRLEKNLTRVYNICVVNPFGNELPQYLVYPPSIPVPETCINTEEIATLSRCSSSHIAKLISGNLFTNAAGSRLLTNLQQHVRDSVYCFLYPEEYTEEIVREEDEDLESVDKQGNDCDIELVDGYDDEDIESIDEQENDYDIESVDGYDDEDIESIDEQEIDYDKESVERDDYED